MIDTAAILGIRSPDIGNALASGLTLAQASQDMQRGNALRAFMAQSGGALMSGDPTALAGYAALDPQGAMGIQSDLLAREAQQQAMVLERERMALARTQAEQSAALAQSVEARAAEAHGWDAAAVRRATEDHARSLDAATLAAEQAELEQELAGLAVLRGQGNRAAFDARLAEVELPPGTVGWDTFESDVARVNTDVLDVMRSFQPAAPTYEVEGGNILDMTPGQVPRMVGTLPVAPEFRTLTPAEVEAQGLPPGAYQRGADGRISAIGGGGTTVNVGAGENAFDKKTGELMAQEAADIVAQGAVASRNLGQLQSLEATLASTPQGAAGGLVAAAGRIGIATEGLDEVQAAQAIINQMVPMQRPPGSGTMSDADLALFVASLPQIMNQPGGNARIIGTMRAVAEYDVARANIARQLQLNQIDPTQAAAAYAALPNPIPADLRQVADETTAPGIPAGSADFATMDARSILEVNTSALTTDQLRAYMVRLDELGY